MLYRIFQSYHQIVNIHKLLKPTQMHFINQTKIYQDLKISSPHLSFLHEINSIPMKNLSNYQYQVKNKCAMHNSDLSSFLLLKTILFKIVSSFEHLLYAVRHILGAGANLESGESSYLCVGHGNLAIFPNNRTG